MTHAQNAWDEAENAAPPVYTHFGQITALSDYVVWPKGTRLSDCPPFDSNQHKPDKRVCRITLMAEPLPGQANPFPHERVVPSYSREWASVTLPSLKKLGVSPRDLDGKWARYEFKVARKYQHNGETKDATSFHFVEIYDNEDAAILAANAFFNNADTDDEPIPGFDDEPTISKDPNYDVAVKFLPALWAQANGNVQEMTRLLAANPLTGKLFTVDSQEVIDVMGANPTSQA